MESRGGPAGTGSADSATVVVIHVVAAGREDAYKPWQQRIIEAARGFDGFEGAEVHPPSSAGSREWVIVYRFATIDQLNDWTQSEVRRRLLDEGRSFFDTPETRDVLVGKPPPRDVVTSVLSHDVLPGMEQEFVRWQDSLTRARKRFPGFMGSELFKPVPGVQDRWVTLFRFDTPEHLGAWLESDTRTKLIQEGRRYLRSYDLHTVKSPFSGWFAFGGARAAIPSWKQAMAVLLALYPTVMVLAHTAGPLFRTLNVIEPLAIFGSLVLSTIILTWILMPVVNRALASWLMPRRANPARTDLIGTAIVVLCYIVLVIAFTVVFT